MLEALLWWSSPVDGKRCDRKSSSMDLYLSFAYLWLEFEMYLKPSHEPRTGDRFWQNQPKNLLTSQHENPYRYSLAGDPRLYSSHAKLQVSTHTAGWDWPFKISRGDDNICRLGIADKNCGADDKAHTLEARKHNPHGTYEVYGHSFVATINAIDNTERLHIVVEDLFPEIAAPRTPRHYFSTNKLSQN